MELIIAACAGITAGLFVLAVARPTPRHVRRRAFALTAEKSHGVNDSEAPFGARVLRPMVLLIARQLGRVLPTRLANATGRQLRVSASPMSIESFLVLWGALALLAPTLFVLFVVATKGWPGSMFAVLVIGFYAAGAYLPWYVLRRRADRRTRTIDRSLPDAIDLIVTSVESGIALQGAMLNVSRKFGGPIGTEFAVVITETAVGKSRHEALAAMAERTGSRDVRLFVRAVTQAETMGISVAQVLRSQAAELRERRRQSAREKANKVPVKMTIPTVLFIFPTMFLLVIGPVALQAIEVLK